jgi:hypothetical protein
VVDRGGIKSALAHGIKPENVAVLRVVPGRLEDATFVYRDTEGAPEGIVAVETYAAQVSVDGRPYVARLVVREAQDGRRFYDHELSGLEGMREAGHPVAPARRDFGFGGGRSGRYQPW